MCAKNTFITVALSLALWGIGAPPALAYRWGHGDIHNIAFEQCMYAKGNQVPGFRTSRYRPPPPPPPAH